MTFIQKNKSKLILVLVLIGFLLLNSFGFCWSKFKFLSDQERIEIAVRNSVFISKSAETIIETSQGVETIGNTVRYYTKVQNVMPYRSLKEFFLSNPNCCKISRQVLISEGINSVTLMGCLTGLAPYFVAGKYKQNYMEDGRVKTQISGFTYRMSSCGNLKYPNIRQFFDIWNWS